MLLAYYMLQKVARQLLILKINCLNWKSGKREVKYLLTFVDF